MYLILSHCLLVLSTLTFSPTEILTWLRQPKGRLLHVIGDENQTEMEMDESIGDEGGEKDDINEEKCTVSFSNILNLLRDAHGFTCQQNGCKKPVNFETNPIITAVIFSWQCEMAIKALRIHSLDILMCLPKTYTLLH